MQRKLFGMMALVSMAGPAFAADELEGSAVAGANSENGSAGEIVVTAGGFAQQIQRAPASMTVIDRRELETQPFRDLTDALRNVEGVAVTGNSNERDIYIRGLPGAYTLLLVDGRRQSTRDSRTNGNAGFEQSFLPPAEAIERIEVVRGPMSSLYGSDAMGGVINVITRKIPERWGGSFSVDHSLQTHDAYGNNNQLQLYLAGPVVADKIGVQMWGRRFHREEARLLNGFNGANDTDINGRIAIRPAPGHEIVVEAGTQRVKRINSGGRTLPAAFGTQNNRNDRDHYAAWYDGKLANGATVWASIQQEETQRYTYSANAQGALVRQPRAPNVRNRVGDFRMAWPVLGGLTLVAGGQWTNTRLLDENPGQTPRGGAGTADRFTITQVAGFLEGEWKITQDFSLTAGTRLDHHEIYGSHWSPRAYAVWEAVPGLVLKGGVTTGFRAPEIRQIAPGYAYTTGGFNCSYGPNGTCAVIVGDPDLGAEKSTSYEIGASYDSGHGFNAGLTLFHTDFKDRVVDVQRLDANGDFVRWTEDRNYRLYQWVNLDRARIRGIEATVRWQVVPTLGLRAGYTYTDSEQRSGDYAGYPLARTPEHRANGRIEWTPVTALTLYASGWYNGREINAALRAGTQGQPIVTPAGRTIRRYPGYFLGDVGASYRLPVGVLLNLAVQNVSDKRLDDLTYNSVNDGRSLWLGATFRF